MNRDEFEFGFDPEEEKEVHRPKAGNTGHTFVPAFRQAETEESRPRRSTAFHREQEEETYIDLDSDFDEDDAELDTDFAEEAGLTGRSTSRRQRLSADREPRSRRESAAHREGAVRREGTAHGSRSRHKETSERRGSAVSRNTGQSGHRDSKGPGRFFGGLTLRGLILLIAAQITAFAVIGCVWWGKRMWSNMQTDTEFNQADMTNPYISVEKEEQMKGYWTVALFGVDSRNSSVGKGNMSDVIILCTVNQETGAIKLTSVFRDTYLNIDEKNSYNKINLAYSRGGPKQAVEALNRNLDLQIDDYATFNWKAVADAINILGGVDVELSKAEFYYINAYITETVESTNVGSHHLKKAGPNHLDGVQAVAYARLRKMDTDFARTERQRKIIELSFEKLKKADFAVVNNVMEIVFPQILTSVTLNDVIPMAKNLTKYHIAATSGFPEARSDAILGKKGDCVIPQTLESNVIKLHQFLFDDEAYTPSEMVKKISAKISADTGMYKEGKPIESVGTDGGYVPKATTAAQTEEKTSENETEASEGSSESSQSVDESIIDGEYPWDLELETDENGNVIDPPENYGPGMRPSESSGIIYPGQSKPGTTEPSGSLKPTAPSGTLPSATTEAVTKPTKGTESTSEGPGSVEPGDALGGPGAVTEPSVTNPSGAGQIKPGQSKPGPTESSSSGVMPGAGNVIIEENTGNDVIIGPGA